MPADYNGGGTSDLAVFDPNTGVWSVRGQFNATWGTSTDIPVPADFNGDGKAEVTIFRPSTGMWMVKGVSNTLWGAAGDYPLPAPDTNANGVPYQ